MKTTLLAFLCIALFSCLETSAQPCDLASVYFERVYTGTDGKCYADVYFDMDRNNGNKFIYLHFWTKANFNKVSKARFFNGAGPKNEDINGTPANLHPALATIAIDNENYTAPVWNAYNYRPDASVPVVKGTRLQVSSAPVSGTAPKALYRYTITAVPLGNLGGSCSADDLSIIMWSTQANSVNSHIHCSLMGPATKQKLTITGDAKCAVAKYTITINNPTDKAVAGSVDVYADNGVRPNDGAFDPATDAKFDAVNYFVVEPNQAITITRAIPSSYLGYNLYTQFMLANYSTQTELLSTTGCGTLPVSLLSVAATRNRQNVEVKWQTASEQDIRSFTVLRNTNEGWKVAASVPSQAANGLSSQTLSYQFTDLNSYKGISQYRVQAVAVDGSVSLSEVKMVRGEAASVGLTVFPNPSSSGKAMLVFDNAAVKDIIVSDVSGRVIKQLIGITSTNAAIDQLASGFYNIQVIDRTTNETKTARLIVKK
jgi:hypothetical protein